MSFTYTDWGRIAYADALEMQTSAFEELLKAKISGGERRNRLFFCEHRPVLTIGKSGNEHNLLVSESFLAERGITLYRINRGGDITYHGPGQITGYPVFDLEYWKIGLKQYVHRLEEIILCFLAFYHIKAERLKGATGVWINAQAPSGARKICAIGIKSSRYVTMHGFALNINTDINGFSLINPCGFTDKGVTSLEKELGAPQDMEQAKELLLKLFKEAFPSDLLFRSPKATDL
jgi:lipoyl(octanoyl) transferase